MSDAALSRIAHLIKVEDDLGKIESFKEQFIKEKASVDSKLNKATENQIESIQLSLAKLNTSATMLGQIKANLGKVNQVYDESITNIRDYDTIKKMTSINQYLTQVLNLYEDISHFKQHLDMLNNMIQHEFDIISEDIAYPLDNIFRIHYNLTQARNFLDYMEDKSQDLTDDFKSIVYKIVNPIKRTIRKFDELLREIIISIIEALKEGNGELVFKLIKVIEFESNEDLKCHLVSTLKLNESKDYSSINYSTYRGTKRNYKKFFFDKLQESLEETFNKCLEHFQEDKLMVYDNLGWLEDELMYVELTVASLFPEHWDLSNFVENVYYNKLHEFTMGVIKTDPPAEDLMKILSYDVQYGNFLVALHSLGEDDTGKKSTKKEQKSIIGDDLKNSVLEDYLKVIVTKMDEWTENLIKQETETFLTRDSPDIYTYHQTIEDEDAQDRVIMLDVDNEVFVLPDFKTPLTMLKEQADVAANSGYGKILVGVIEHWSLGYLKRTANYMRIIGEEYDKYMDLYSNEKFLIKESKASSLFRRRPAHRPAYENIDDMTPEQLAEISRPGLIEYMTALGNTYEINTDRLQDKFLPNYKSKVHTSYQGRIEQAFEDTLNPSMELNGQIIRNISDIIINDLYPALSTVFTKSWYEDKSPTSDKPNMAERIVETIGEYMGELRGFASYDMYMMTFTILLNKFISSYIRIGYENILHGSGKKIDPDAVKKYKSFSEGVGRDVTIFYSALEPLFTRKDSALLLNSLRAIEFLGDLATCEDPLGFVPEMWENEILNSFYNCSVDYVKGILLCRKDTDQKQVQEIVRRLQDIKEEYHSNVEPPAVLVDTLDDFTYS